MDFEETVRICLALDLHVNDLCPFFSNYINDADIPSVEFSADESLASRFWTVIDVIRREYNKSWEDVARETGIKRSTISTARSYRRSLPFYRHCYICQVFNLSVGTVVSVITENGIEDSSLSVRIRRLSQKYLQIISDLVDIMLESKVLDK